MPRGLFSWELSLCGVFPSCTSASLYHFKQIPQQAELSNGSHLDITVNLEFSSSSGDRMLIFIGGCSPPQQKTANSNTYIVRGNCYLAIFALVVGTWARYEESVLELIRKTCSWDFLGWKPRKRAHFLCWTCLPTHFIELYILQSAPGCQLAASLRKEPAHSWGRKTRASQRAWMWASDRLQFGPTLPLTSQAHEVIHFLILKLTWDAVTATSSQRPPDSPGGSGQPASGTSVVLSNGVVTCWVRSEFISHQ